MAKMRRRVSAEIPVRLPGILISIGNGLTTEARHASYLEDQFRLACKLYSAGGYRLDYCARLAVCGRLVSVRSLGHDYQRSNYCRCNGHCSCCHACREHSRASCLAEGIQFSGSDWLLMGVLRLPSAATYKESVELLKKGSAGMFSVRKAINGWNKRRSKGNSTRVKGYTLGLHLMPSKSSDHLWTHLHLALVVGGNVKQYHDEHDGIYRFLGQAFAHEVDLENVHKVHGSKPVRLSSRKLDEQERRKQHRGKTISHDDLIRIFAYTSRKTEVNDTAEIKFLRDKMIKDAGNPKLSTHSRRRSREASDPSSKSSVGQPNCFDPCALGHSDARVFRFGNIDSESFEASTFAEMHSELHEEAKRLIQSPPQTHIGGSNHV
ncbi:hypothetical protein [Neorhodopirellula lusitana]|uniref:hypothetical protein n=1 Tax=Neorhodopirellula lusitana TaxID=445327 RepID=UPI0038516DE7